MTDGTIDGMTIAGEIRTSRGNLYWIMEHPKGERIRFEAHRKSDNTVGSYNRQVAASSEKENYWSAKEDLSQKLEENEARAEKVG